MIDPLFEKVYNEELLNDLAKRFGPFQQHHIELSVSTTGMKTKSRRGEVVMVVPNEQGHIWLHTKAVYPPGTYRLMTGGLEGDEVPHLTLLREVEEETGFKTKIDRCLAVITYTLSGGEKTLPFVSYVFLTMPTAGQPQSIDPNEAIAGFRAIPVAALADTALELRSLEGDFADWGIFRAIAHEVAGELLLAA